MFLLLLTIVKDLNGGAQEDLIKNEEDLEKIQQWSYEEVREEDRVFMGYKAFDTCPRITYIYRQKGKNMKKTDKKDGINVDIRSKEVAYITIKTLAGKWTIYVDNSTGEHIIESWQE